MVHLSEMAPPRSVSGSVDVSESSETSATSNVVIRTAMTEEQLNEFILSCSKGVGTLVHTIEEEIEKLPEGVQSQVRERRPGECLGVYFMYTCGVAGLS